MIFWIASYPKSGNTWLRALISSYFYSKDGFFKQEFLKRIEQFPEKKYFKNFNYNPTIITDTTKFWIEAQERINEDKKTKFFKTHNILGAINKNDFTNKKNSLGAIYIIRDPRNVLTSLQNHYELTLDDALKFMLNENKFIHDHHIDNDFSDFQFISSWERNYQSWKYQNIFPVKIIKYEDLNTNTFETFKDIIEFINKILKNFENFNIQKAKNSIQSTTFYELKKIEKDEGFVEAVRSKNTKNKVPFFNLGPKNDWKKIFIPEYKKKLNSVFDKSLRELNYLD